MIGLRSARDSVLSIAALFRRSHGAFSSGSWPHPLGSHVPRLHLLPREEERGVARIVSNLERWIDRRDPNFLPCARVFGVIGDRGAVLATARERDPRVTARG